MVLIKVKLFRVTLVELFINLKKNLKESYKMLDIDKIFKYIDLWQHL